jgi:hypothetical protein
MGKNMMGEGKGELGGRLGDVWVGFLERPEKKGKKWDGNLEIVEKMSGLVVIHISNNLKLR